MPEPYKVEVRDPPQGVPPPHQQQSSSKVSRSLLGWPLLGWPFLGWSATAVCQVFATLQLLKPFKVNGTFNCQFCLAFHKN